MSESTIARCTISRSPTTSTISSPSPASIERPLADLIFWLTALAGAGLGFLLVFRFGWRLVGAMIVATLAALILSLPLLIFLPAEERSPWLQVEMAMNGSVALIFAGAAAAAALALRSRADR